MFSVDEIYNCPFNTKVSIDRVICNLSVQKTIEEYGKILDFVKGNTNGYGASISTYTFEESAIIKANDLKVTDSTIIGNDSPIRILVVADKGVKDKITCCNYWFFDVFTNTNKVISSFFISDTVLTNNDTLRSDLGLLITNLFQHNLAKYGNTYLKHFYKSKIQFEVFNDITKYQSYSYRYVAFLLRYSEFYLFLMLLNKDIFTNIDELPSLGVFPPEIRDSKLDKEIFELCMRNIDKHSDLPQRSDILKIILGKEE